MSLASPNQFGDPSFGLVILTSPDWFGDPRIGSGIDVTPIPKPIPGSPNHFGNAQTNSGTTELIQGVTVLTQSHGVQWCNLVSKSNIEILMVENRQI
jgi:hypothetical protein